MRLARLLLPVLAAGALARPPAFELLPLGTYGGGYDGNLTCFALRRPGDESFRLLVDGGSLTAGVARWRHPGVPEAGLRRYYPEVEDFFLGLEHALLTHSHLDHMSGLIVHTPSLFGRKAPLNVHGTRHTMDALKQHVFLPAIWGDMVAAGRVVLNERSPAEEFEAAGFRVRPFAIDHVVPTFGYEILAPGGEAYVHLGDTGPTEGDREIVRRHLAAGSLRALSLECSFESKKEKLSLDTGHLTPDLLVRHLGELVDVDPTAPDGVRVLADRFRGVRLLVQHIKPGDEAGIRREIQDYRRRGLPLIVPRQGRLLRF